MNQTTGVNQMNQPNLIQSTQTQTRGSNDNEYQIYLACADNGKGIDFTTGKPLKTYDEWMAS